MYYIDIFSFIYH